MPNNTPISIFIFCRNGEFKAAVEKFIAKKADLLFESKHHRSVTKDVLEENPEGLTFDCRYRCVCEIERGIGAKKKKTYSLKMIGETIVQRD